MGLLFCGLLSLLLLSACGDGTSDTSLSDEENQADALSTPGDESLRQDRKDTLVGRKPTDADNAPDTESPDSQGDSDGDSSGDALEPEEEPDSGPPLPPCEVVVPPEAEWTTGPQEDGSYLLPGGRAIERLGPWLETGGFPSDSVANPLHNVVYVTIAGRNERHLIVVDTMTATELQRINRASSFYGIELSPDGKWLYASGGASHVIERYPVVEDGTLGQGEALDMGGFPSGMAIHPNGEILWVGLFGGELLNPIAGVREVNTTSWTLTRSLDLSAIVWDLVYHPDSEELYVSDLGGEGIYVVDTIDLKEVDKIEVPISPAGMLVHPDSSRIWVAVSGADAIATLDPITHLVTQWTPVTDLAWVDEDGEPLPHSNVNSLAYDPSQDRLFATRGADNAVSLFDATSMELLGAYPTAWYPTSVAYLPGQDMLVVSEGKGYGKGPDDESLTAEELGALLRDGAITFLPLADIDLAEATEKAAAAFARPTTVFPFECNGFFPLPTQPGQTSPIEHVILVVKENKTFDCVFGDLTDMDVKVDPSLVRWGEEITPNLHALAREFCISDNFYAEVPNSDVGHLFLTAGHLTEYTERMWKEDVQFNLNAAFPFEEATMPAHGNLFTHLINHGVSTQIFGEIVGMMAQTAEGKNVLEYTDMSFPGGFLVNYSVTDTSKAEYVAQTIEDGLLAEFTYLLLPNDHTNGTAPGTPSPESMVADNDYAVGLLVDAVSKSKYWEKTLIIVTQDDTQGCDDHVDLHRAFVLLISPWAKRQHVSHLHTSFPSIMGTMGAILGVPPMGRLDASATQFIDCFSGTLNTAPYDVVERTYPEEMNPSKEPTPGAEESSEMSWRSPDRNPGLGIILDAYRLWKMGKITKEEAFEKIAAGPQNEETWEEWVEESHEDTLAFDQAWKRYQQYRATQGKNGK